MQFKTATPPLQDIFGSTTVRVDGPSGKRSAEARLLGISVYGKEKCPTLTRNGTLEEFVYVQQLRERIAEHICLCNSTFGYAGLLMSALHYPCLLRTFRPDRSKVTLSAKWIADSIRGNSSQSIQNTSKADPKLW